MGILNNDDQPKNEITGWLAFLGIVICLSPIWSALVFSGSAETLYLMVDTNSNAYKPAVFYHALLYSITYLSFVFLEFYLLVLFFMKHHKFPLVFIIHTAFFALFVYSEILYDITYNEGVNFKEDSGVIIALTAWFVITTLYILKSKRVKYTFSKDKDLFIEKIIYEQTILGRNSYKMCRKCKKQHFNNENICILCGCEHLYLKRTGFVGLFHAVFYFWLFSIYWLIGIAVKKLFLIVQDMVKFLFKPSP